jgi:pyrrolidone-carboxylate peptidase
MRPSILLTGFKPYAMFDPNPSQVLLQAMTGSPGSFPDVSLQTLVLETDYGHCEAQLRDAVSGFSPDAVISYGLNFDADELRLERLAVNILPGTGNDLRRGQRISDVGSAFSHKAGQSLNRNQKNLSAFAS